MRIDVTDPDDPRLDDYRGLTDADLRRRVETGHGAGLFIAEGLFVIERLTRSPYPVRSVFVNEAKWRRLEPLGLPDDVPVYVGPTDLLTATAGFRVHRGALAAAHRLPPRPLADVATGRLVVVLDGLTNAENVGAIFRSASALGADGVLLSPTCVDPLYRRAVRVSMGEVLALSWRVAEDWPGELDALAASGFTLVALDPAGAVPVATVGAGRVALVLGEEGPGVSAAVLARCPIRAMIPMRPGVDSLNVGAAAAIALDRLGQR